MHGLSLVAASAGYSSLYGLRCTYSSLYVLFVYVAVHGLLIAVASLVAEHGL